MSLSKATEDQLELSRKFTEVIERRFKELDLTISQLSVKSDVCESHLNAIFGGNKVPSFLTISKLVKALDMDVSINGSSVPDYYPFNPNCTEQENKEYADLNKALETVNRLIVMEREQRRSQQ